jgi:beta-galactosidase/beta-glucuronidase
MKRLAHLVAILAVFSLGLAPVPAAWQPAPGPLMTRWTKDVKPDKVHPEYPRPQMERKEWQNLNGLWSYSIVPKDAPQPAFWDGEILVPFPVESALSGVMKRVSETQRLWYRRTFTVPKKWQGQRVLLHFGAVDWETTVWVNGRELGAHRGGYDGFSFDLTDALKPSGEQEIVVAVWDPTDAGTQPRGKQVRRPGGIWYTPTSGIWQTAWLEPVPAAYISQLRIVPDLDNQCVRVTAQVAGNPGAMTVTVEVKAGRKSLAVVSGKPNQAITVPVSNAKLWSPDTPFLYDLGVMLGKDQDRVASYFGMRKIALAKDADGINRLFLNNQPLFQYGPLDQGFWPDGLYTAPTDEVLRYDIEMTKRLGFNMARKHVKVEPDRWYYWADKLGLLVWQDMPSGDKYIGANDPDITRTPESAKQFETELKAMVDGFYNHPSIVMWVPYNEGWGQWDTCRIVDLIRAWDPTRLVNNTSGWSDRGCGDVNDLHRYPGPGVPKLEDKRAAVLGEFGGLGLPVSGHTWQSEKNWGYRSFTNSESLTAAYLGLVAKLHPLTGKPGLTAAVYTQTTDVEVEVNGLMTYDRAVLKVPEKEVAAANRRLYLPPPPAPITTTLASAANEAPATWRFTTNAPAADWFQPGFDAAAWKEGRSGFGTRGTPGAAVRTEWSTPQIWLRRTFDLPADFKAKGKDYQLVVHHDEDAEVYLNGELVAQLAGHESDYVTLPLPAKGVAALRPGPNTLAVHCRQTNGGQYIDAGLLELTPVAHGR